MAESENEKEGQEKKPEEEAEGETEEPEATLTQLIDRNKSLIKGLKEQLDRAKKKMMDTPEE